MLHKNTATYSHLFVYTIGAYHEGLARDTCVYTETMVPYVRIPCSFILVRDERIYPCSCLYSGLKPDGLKIGTPVLCTRITHG